MSFSKKDKALVVSSALVGYCQSIPLHFTVMSSADKEMFQQWINGLTKRVKQAETAIDEALSETLDGKV